MINYSKLRARLVPTSFMKFIVLMLLLFGLSACGAANETVNDEPSNQNNIVENESASNGNGEFVVDDSPVEVTMAGASAGGLWQVIGESFANAVRGAYPDSSVAYEPGNPAGSLVRMINGETEMSGSPSIIELKLALEGKEPFQQAYSIDDFYILGKVYETSASHTLMRADFAEKHGIESLSDIREKQIPIRISLNTRGNLSEFVPGETLLEEHGITLEDIEAWGGEIVYSSSSQTVEEMKDGKLDMFIGNGFPPHGRFVDLASGTDLKMLKLDDAAVQKTIEKWGLHPYTFEPGVYDFVTEPMNSFSIDAYLLLGPHVSEEVGYKLAKAMHENINDLRGAYASFKDLDMDTMLDVGEFKLHPGVERYFKDQGIIE